jgi:hypothetical protein
LVSVDKQGASLFRAVEHIIAILRHPAMSHKPYAQLDQGTKEVIESVFEAGESSTVAELYDLQVKYDLLYDSNFELEKLTAKLEKRIEKLESKLASKSGARKK